MAGRGPAPKPDEKRQRRNAAPETTELEPRAPAGFKPPRLPGSKGFLAATRSWYRVWCQSPQAQTFLSTDWQRLHMLAPLVDAYFRDPQPRVLAEIRLNEQKLGGTPEDRLRLRWRLRESGDGDGEEVGEEKSKPRRSRARRDPRLQLVQGGAKTK